MEKTETANSTESEGINRLRLIEDLAKRRGFFWQSSEIYGGLGGFYDYGHLGAELKKRFENLWRSYFLKNAYEIEPAHIMHEKVFIASGHAGNFLDPVAKCTKCKTIRRADHILEEFLGESFEGLTPEELGNLIKKHNVKCSRCKGSLETAGTFNMMFLLDVGVDNPQKAYLRPETAQGVYVNFRRIFEQTRRNLPLGIACISKAYRNEISPRQLLMRMREFTQAELQLLFDPEKISESDIDEDYELTLLTSRKNEPIKISCADAISELKLPKLYVHHMELIQKFYFNILKTNPQKFRFRELGEEERAFYNKLHWDVELDFTGLGFKEVAGLHYRTDHDLSAHQKISQQSMEITVDGRKFIPHVLEVSFGVDRNILFLLDSSFNDDKANDRILLSLPRRLAPFDCIICPLISKEGLPEKATGIAKKLGNAGFKIFYDDGGSIGRRYRRADEIGIPAGITIDHQTLDDNTVTLRDRDSMKQVRLAIKDIEEVISRFLDDEDIGKLGETVK